MWQHISLSNSKQNASFVYLRVFFTNVLFLNLMLILHVFYILHLYLFSAMEQSYMKDHYRNKTIIMITSILSYSMHVAGLFSNQDG